MEAPGSLELLDQHKGLGSGVTLHIRLINSNLTLRCRPCTLLATGTSRPALRVAKTESRTLTAEGAPAFPFLLPIQTDFLSNITLMSSA
jgi:hypothetical protein